MDLRKSLTEMPLRKLDFSIILSWVPWPAHCVTGGIRDGTSGLRKSDSVPP